MSKHNHPKQREIWQFDPDPVVGCELGYKPRPALIISNNMMNQGSSNMVIIVPCTSKHKSIPSHIRIDPPNGGLESVSFAVCDQIRAISKGRLIKKYGIVDPRILKEVLDWIADLIRFDS